MKEFRVTLTHRSGELARVTQLFANEGINLRSVAGVSDGHKALICLVAEDVARARAALEGARVQFVEAEVLTELIEDDPGEVAALAGRLADAGVNINSLYILARDTPLVEVGFTVDDAKKAKHVLQGAS
jgi:hypothetical protein